MKERRSDSSLFFVIGSSYDHYMLYIHIIIYKIMI